MGKSSTTKSAHDLVRNSVVDRANQIINQFDPNSNFTEVFNQVPIPFLITTSKREVIYCNDHLIKNLELNDLDSLIGLKPGEIFSCTNSFLGKNGCGTSHHCNFCGIKNAVNQCIKIDNQVITETQMSIIKDKKEIHLDYKVTAKPINFKDLTLIVISLLDIANEKRKEQLEHTFYHDLLNKATSIDGLTKLLSIKIGSQATELIKMLERSSKELIDEITYQRNFTYAENGTLTVNYRKLNSLLLLENLKEDFHPHNIMDDKNIIVDKHSKSINFDCDPVLMDRILINLTKNAIEAISPGNNVYLSCRSIGHDIVFSIKNNTILSDKKKSLLFHRSFSTKGNGRGIGTYSVKLFTERFLRGKVWFESTAETGTIFHIQLPISKPSS